MERASGGGGDLDGVGEELRGGGAHCYRGRNIVQNPSKNECPIFTNFVCTSHMTSSLEFANFL